MPVYFLEIIVICLGLLMLLIDAFADIKDKRTIGYFGVIGLLVTLGLVFTVKWPTPEEAQSAFWNFYALGDAKSLFFKGIAIAATLLVLIMAIDYTPLVMDQTAEPEEGAHPQAGLGEFFALPLFACAGLMWMASANHLVSIFVALETVTIAFYVMVAYLRRNVGSLEAGVKYLILGALSTGFLVYGMAWLYGMTGSMELPVIRERLASGEVNQVGTLFAFALILMAMAFKVGAVPFHNWIPDVYQGAPTPITAFLAVGSKAAGFIVFMRIVAMFLASPSFVGKTTLVLSVLAALTLLIGNLVALPQTNFKRLLAYSSIAHAGFLLMAMASTPESGKTESMAVSTVISFYLGTYLLMTLLAFLVVTVMRSSFVGENLEAYAGMARKSPFLAVAMLVSMASLAGIPLTGGFFGKFFVFKLAFDQEQWVLLGVGAFGACAGFYYYLKIAASMFLKDPPSSRRDAEPIRINPATRIAMSVLMVSVIVVGVNPSLLLRLIG